MTSVVYPDSRTQLYMYDAQDRLTLTCSPKGKKKTYVYHKDKNLLKSIIEPDNSVSIFEYNDNNLIKEIRKNGNSLYLEYDAQHNLCCVTDAQGQKSRWEYDFMGNVTSVADPAGNHQLFSYDSLGRVNSIQTQGKTTHFHYNAYQEITQIKEQDKVLNLEYTPLGSLIKRELNGISTRFAYDPMERLKEITNEKGEKYRIERNLRGEITKEISFDNKLYSFKRNALGEIIKILRPNEQWTEYEYNKLGQIIEARYSDGSYESFRYTLDGELKQASNEHNCIELKRDAQGRVIEEKYSSGLLEAPFHLIQSKYDKNGNRTELKSSLGAEIQNKFDKQGRLSELCAQRIPTDPELNSETPTHRPEGQIWKACIKRNLLGEEIEKSINGAVILTQEYTSWGEPQSLKVRALSRETLHIKYNWDANHKLKQTLNQISQGKIDYAYDALGSLAQARYEDGSYEYKLPDEIGNLYNSEDKKDRVYGAAGKLLRDKNWSYVYDKEGNLILKTARRFNISNKDNHLKPHTQFWIDEKQKPEVEKGFWIDDRPAPASLFDNEFDHKAEIRKYSKAELKQYDQIRKQRQQQEEENLQWQEGDWEYNWQGNGLLKSIRNPQGEYIYFRYDALGRRTAKIAGNRIYRYLWEGNVILHEWSYLTSEAPEVVWDTLGLEMQSKPEPVENLITWIYEPGSWVPTGKIEGDKQYSIISDYLGRPLQAYSREGYLVWETEYDIYGGLRNLKGERGFIPFRQLGQYEDTETGLYYNRFRYYNPQTGSYISQDPIGIAGNNPNLYAYTSDSNLEVDPWGLSECGWGKKINFKLDKDLANTFFGGKYKSYILKEDKILYRAGKKDAPLGQFFSKDAPVSELQVRIDKAILPVWPDGGKSIIDTGYKILIPKGTTVHVGDIAPQGGFYLGGTQQILIEKPWTIDGLKVLEDFPLLKIL